MHSNKIIKSKSTAKINVISTVVVLVLVGIGILGYMKWVKVNVDTDNHPPTLSLGSDAYKGEVAIGDLYMTFPNASAQAVEPAAAHITLKPGFNYVYSTSEKSVTEIVGDIVSDKSNVMLMIAYSPSSNLFGQTGYNVYKKGPYTGTNEVTNPAESIIPAYYGFIMYTKKEAYVLDLKDSSSALTVAEGQSLINSLSNVNGWVLIPTTSSANISGLFGSLKSKVLYFSKLKTKSNFDGADFEEGTTGANNLTLNSNANFMWVKLGTPGSACNPGQYFGLGSCNNCNSSQYYNGATAGIQCVQCASGSPFTEASGCGAACNSPQYLNTSGTCTSCNPGYRYTGGGQCRTCTPSEYSSGMCESCTYPNFAFTGSSGVGCTACKLWQIPSGSMKSCIDCGAGQTYNSSSSTCVSCTSGQYNSSQYASGLGACKLCPSGQPWSGGVGECRSCLSYQYVTGSAPFNSCGNCSPGTRFSGGVGCVSCTNSQYNAGSCHPCSAPTGIFTGIGGSGGQSAVGYCTY